MRSSKTQASTKKRIETIYFEEYIEAQSNYEISSSSAKDLQGQD